ncbi:taste receptor type 1 member 3 [Terrapene carolina triunguis]|uniref:taste receptor type 1 member 3 n=1 Tax=Terrapene triunguis TaxID=2587831 RepID=UPI000E77D026|nr:taste receptor type 1 member 3 [Terrapene carolina triunguis]
MARVLLLYLSLGCSAAHGRTCMSAQFKKPGDYILGGLFPFGMNTMNLSERLEPSVVVCERLYASGLIWALGMKFAIDEINNSTSLLPGIKLGYEIYDTCLEPVVVIQPSLLFLTREGSTGIRVLCSYTDYQTRVTAVIGPYVSDLALITAKLFGFFLIPQVSYGASSEKLSQEEYYPSFFRTVPSDKSQSKALVQLLDMFEWNWIAAIGSENEYGREGLGTFSSLATAQGICIAYEALIPADPSVPQDHKTLEKIIKYINETQVNVIVLFSVDRPVKALLEQWISHGFSQKVWIATEAWVMSDIVTSIPNIQTIGTVIGFTIKGGIVPGFQDYVTDLFASVQQESFCRASWEYSRDADSAVLGPQCSQCDNVSLHDVAHLLENQQTYAVYVAVYSVAHTLHQALGCTEEGCPKATVKSWQLLDIMKELQFTLDNQSFQMDQFHSTNQGYDVMFWSWQKNSLQYIPVGDYRESLRIDTAQIQFHTMDSQKPVSTCFRRCELGQIKRVKGFHLCCYDCIDCEENTYQSTKEDLFCTDCPEHQWSPIRSAKCYDRSERYLFWDEPLTIGLLVLMLFATVLTCLSAVLFLKNLNTPLVQASGGARSIFALLCLLLMCLSLCLQIGKPSTASCMVQQPLYTLCLSACFSTFLVKSLEIVLLTEFTSCPKSFLLWVTQKRAWLVVAVASLVESMLCFWYIYSVPAFPERDYKLLHSQVLIRCRIQSWFAFILIHGYTGGQAFICFLCTFMVQTPAKKYNIARGITFSMLSYFVTWIAFVATYSTVQATQLPAAQICSGLLCALGLLASYYLPKCYILLFKPEWNTVAYFQLHQGGAS